mmetsp:Transcript_40858/g.89006  ORF Transcript_40858/g.89006 Transcript_40858/m.89006 type:complete len:660 (+) Transcript_40858:78-2057(+)|eukprot:CAMPEP_0204271026 /NCGR_PEP_ID=MMETSP0468-20130131/19222_1 /ASSEMBLY_ACC=CAM_ASM_000383 /TAXON_ID=2969 /ORGANISM="Oxyrrhis marina" /LENGTH=659 /DNA_ID=CAMNT_0051246629 /DNA_START=76 /DNA_END=2055 /DNA_ORIENTATION=+
MRVVASFASAAVLASEERPITKVVNLLKEMQHQLEGDAQRDEETYNKLVCWCQSSDKEKTEAIANAQSRITDLTAAIEENSAYSAQLEVELKQHAKELAQGKNALGEARSVREHTAEDWYATEKDLVQSIAALKNAIMLLNKQHASSLVQVARLAETALAVRSHAVAGLSAQQHSTLTAFLQQPASAGSYNSHSGEITGILNSMLEEMEKDLEEGRTSESKEVSDYGNLKSTKTAENDASKKAIATKKQELAITNEKLETAKEDMADTRSSLAADVKFLSDLKLRCQSTDKEYSTRVAERQTEMSAVQDTIKILTEDDAAETMTRSMSLLQVGAETRRRQERRIRQDAAHLLLQVASKTGNKLIAALAARVELDVFTKIKQAIDEMTAQLKQEMADEVKHRDYCVSELDTNTKDTAIKAREISETEDTIDDLKQTIDELTKEIAQANKEIAENQVEIKKAGMVREAENADFQATLQDQRATEDILKKAMTRLTVVYGKTQEERLGATGASSFVQHAASPPPAGFEKKEKNSGSTGVMSMIESLIEDAKDMQAQATKDEEQAQADYEKFVADSNDSIARLETSVTNKSGSKASAREQLAQAKNDLAAAQGDDARLGQLASDLHQDCDFTLKNFEIRQQAREDELAGMAQAKSILSGADFA